MNFTEEQEEKQFREQVTRLIEQYFGRPEVTLRVAPNGKVQLIRDEKVIGEQG